MIKSKLNQLTSHSKPQVISIHSQPISYFVQYLGRVPCTPLDPRNSTYFKLRPENSMVKVPQLPVCQRDEHLSLSRTAIDL